MRPASTSWADEAPVPPWRPLEHDTQCQFLVIGAGFAGLAVARELERRGADVLTVDADAPGAGASTRNAGFVLLTHPWDYPEVRRRIGPDGTRALLSLARRTHQIIEQDHGAAVGHRRCGSLMLEDEDGPFGPGTLDEAVEMLSDDGVTTEWTTAPAGTRGFSRALLIPDDGEVHPGALVASLAARLNRVALATVTSLDAHARVAFAGALTIRFEHVIVCTNAWTERLLPGARGLITPQRAQVLVTAPVRHALERPCYSTGGYDYFRQRSDGALVLGGRRHLHRASEATDDPRPTDGVQTDLERFIEASLPFAAGAAVQRRWAGLMGFTPDDLPLVGPLPSAPENASVLAGWNGHGVGLALGCAERLAGALGGGPRTPEMLDPARFPTMLDAR
jgi:glycine/D-amino acid oxidase-like deaminating enzyme